MWRIGIFANASYTVRGMHGTASTRRSHERLFSILAGGLLALGCGASSDAVGPASGGPVGGASAAGGGSAGASGASAGAGGARYREPSELCRAPAGVSNNPQSIAETVALINALPKPLSIPCFLESLARPLSLMATFGVLSAQPAVGLRSPRMFLIFGPNRMSIVPAGVGANLLEFGEDRPNYRSLKAELEFPVTEQVPPSAPYDRVMFSANFTTCALCHAAEQNEASPFTTNAFTSQSLRPAPRNAVSLQSLQHELAVCDRGVEPYRCALLDSLFSLGPVTEAQFPVEMQTFE